MAESSGNALPMEQRGSSQLSVELDILHLSEQWVAQRTIRNGDTPGQALRKGPRPALASICANVAAPDAVNPFSFTAQRKKVTAVRIVPKQLQPAVRFAVEPAAGMAAAAGAATAGAENALPAARAACAGVATPATALPATLSRCTVATGAAGAGACAGGSPSPLVLFRGRLSFAAAEADSARKFDRPTTVRKPGAAAGASLKRKLLISPGADISAAFPTLLKPSAKQRRRSVSDVGPSWAARAARAEAEDGAAAAGGAWAAAGPAAAEALGAGHQAGVSDLDVYWSDPLPLPGGTGLDGVAAGAACAEGLAADDDMQDTAASPSSSSGGAASPRAGAMDTCCCSASPAPAFSPLRAQQQALPTVDHPSCGFPSISVQTMRDMLVHGAGAFGLADFVVVDCRYDYEHAGGHLPGAVHLTTPEELADFLSAPHLAPDHWQRTALILHCEFSTERGPRAAKHVRNKDREAHMHDYPALSQPHVFVLQGGYKAFWRAHPELCSGGYTPMDHPDFMQQLKECHNVVKRAWAKTTRTFRCTLRQRRPSYRLRRSSGVGRGAEPDATAEAAAAAVAQAADAAPAVIAAQHALHPC